MPTDRGWAAIGAGLALWLGARLIGSSDLHMLAVGVLSLPLLAAVYVRWGRVRLEVRRQLSSVRVFRGARVVVSLTVHNTGRRTTSFLLLQDSVPAALGPPARLVVSGIPPGNSQTVSYTLSCRRRGRYVVGPLTIFLSDPFGLVRSKVQASARSELVIYPETEEIEAGQLVAQGAGSGESAVRHLYRSAAEFYTMREYNTGDDLRRIHWPSVARTGDLMIRQDESTRRSAATVFLDTRTSVLGQMGSTGFERAVSVAATVARGLGRAGFGLRLATVDAAPTVVTEEALLETLAGIGGTSTTSAVTAFSRLRASGVADAVLAFVTGPLPPGEIAALSSLGSAFGRKLGVFVYPEAPRLLAAAERGELERRMSAARVSLQRGGWEVYFVLPDERFAEVWKRRTRGKLQVSGLLS